MLVSRGAAIYNELCAHASMSSLQSQLFKQAGHIVGGVGGQGLHLLLVQAGQLLQNLLGSQHLLQVVQLSVGIGVVPGVRPGIILRMACTCRLSAWPGLRVESVHGLHISDGPSLCHPFICPCAALQACEVSNVVSHKQTGLTVGMP